jgi:hypothetical protein
MIREIKTWEVKCDHCPHKITVTYPDEPYAGMLKGWSNYTSGGWGMTNYSKTELLCPKCMEKQEKEENERQLDKRSGINVEGKTPKA